MQYIDYIEIENFKGFGAKVRVPLGNPGVLIGPNNSGKTTVLQALSLWGRAVFEWTERRNGGKLESDGTAVLNRLAILAAPVKETRYFWQGMAVRCKTGPINFSLTVGVRVGNGVTRPLRMEFIYHDNESVKCAPAADCAKDETLLSQSAKLKFGLLHPMSGIASAVSDSTDEPLVASGRVDVLLGQGQTAQALRNVCYQLWEKSPDDWARVAEIMGCIFKCELAVPVFNPGRGSLALDYRPLELDSPLEIVLAGRGLQQMLLLLAYFYGHKGQILLFDEPDAHLEILRQRQMFSLLNEIAEDTSSQMILVTHSEVMLDEAYETNLVSLANGTVANVSARGDIRAMLRNLGVEHYFKAEQKRRLLIVEGSTDVEILRAFARKLNHPAIAILNDTLFTYYTQDVNPEVNGSNRIERFETEGLDYRRYVSVLKNLVPDLRALAIFDSDGKKLQDENITEDFEVVRWKRYEIENYFISPELLKRYLLDSGIDTLTADKCIGLVLAEMLFDGDIGRVGDYFAATATIRAKLLADVKMSKFAENVFVVVASETDSAVLMNKGEYYRLVSLLPQESVPKEIVDRLDLLVQMLSGPVGGAINDLSERADGAISNGGNGADGAISDAVNGNDGAIKERSGATNGVATKMRVYSAIVESPGVNGEKLAAILGVGTSTVDRAVKALKDDGKVEYRGSRKTGGYYAVGARKREEQK